MKALLYVLVFAVIVFLNLGLYLPALFTVDEEDIGRNMNQLKKYEWFNALLDQEEYRHFIIHDRDVRNTIGKLKTKNIDRKYFQHSYRKRLEKLLQKKSCR